MNRKEGFYWIKRTATAKWSTAYYDASSEGWSFDQDDLVPDDYFHTIGERILTPDEEHKAITFGEWIRAQIYKNNLKSYTDEDDAIKVWTFWLNGPYGTKYTSEELYNGPFMDYYNKQK